MLSQRVGDRGQKAEKAEKAIPLASSWREKAWVSLSPLDSPYDTGGLLSLSLFTL
jgi:hypothetical protein